MHFDPTVNRLALVVWWNLSGFFFYSADICGPFLMELVQIFMPSTLIQSFLFSLVMVIHRRGFAKRLIWGRGGGWGVRGKREN